MFNKKLDNAPNDRDVKAFLEEGCEFDGKLSFSGVVRMNGKFKGEIQSNDTLIVGEAADLEGIISVGALILGGKVRGDVTALHRTEIMSTGWLEGNLSTPQLIVKEGATLLAQLKVKKESGHNTKDLIGIESKSSKSIHVNNSTGSHPKEQHAKNDPVVPKAS